jgi:NADPH:quinone reductase-like Zn-dependent oxidoreductase
MQGTGMLVLSWPIVLGCDASGVVAEVGEGVSKFKVGDKVFGCTRLGHAGYGTFQEFVSRKRMQPSEE